LSDTGVGIARTTSENFRSVLQDSAADGLDRNRHIEELAPRACTQQAAP
jgi:hypothetical protein